MLRWWLILTFCISFVWCVEDPFERYVQAVLQSTGLARYDQEYLLEYHACLSCASGCAVNGACLDFLNDRTCLLIHGVSCP